MNGMTFSFIWDILTVFCQVIKDMLILEKS
jgi:hypothetical protein